MSLWQETDAVLAAQVSCVAYDSVHALVWAGDDNGRVCSFYGPRLQPYTSFFAHPGPVHSIHTTRKHVLTLGSDGVRCYKRTGVLVSSSPSATGDVLLLLNTNEFLVAHGRRVKRFSIEPNIKETGHFSIDAVSENVNVTHMQLATPNVALGLSDGTVLIVDPQTFDPVLPAPIPCHGETITDMQCEKNLLVTCGLCRRRFGGLFPDVFATCYDLRACAPLPPLSCSMGASFVKLHPKSPNHAILLNSSGLLMFSDMHNPADMAIRQVLTTSPIIGMDINSLGDSLVVAERNSIHHWSINPARNMDETFAGLEVPSAPSEPVFQISPDDQTKPLSLIGLPYFNQPLLSQWPRLFYFEVGMPVPNWANVPSMQLAQTHAECRRRRRRASSFGAPRFLSEKERLGTDAESFAFVDMMKNDDSAARGRVPKLWRQMHIHYSKFGIDDFDFDFYNSTPFSGLETLSSNPFCNAVIQLLRWCPPVYNETMQAFAKNNFRDLKLTGELAIVFDMLVKAEGHQCRATNFIDSLEIDVSVLGAFNQIMEALFSEYENEIDSLSPLRKHMEINLRRKEFGSCGFLNVGTKKAYKLSACSSSGWAIQSGLSRTKNESSKCLKCGTDHMLAVSEAVLDSPEILFIEIESSSKLRKLETGHVPSQFGVRLGSIKPSLDLERNDYTLMGYIAEISNENERHAVTVVKIRGEWYLFNDFLVSKLPESEALDFQPVWKSAKLLMYGRDANNFEFDTNWTSSIDTRLLYEPRIVSGNMENKASSSPLLRKDEAIPDLVALDAEFVLLAKEVSEIYSDGSKTLIEPKQQGLARVSVVREDGSVLIDDRVEMKREIIEYFTAFSGVEPGDLDPVVSRFSLVSRATATRRLWILLNKGTKFVGHALSNDFRTINLYVPPSQFFDTIKLFHDQDRNGFRRLSLKFLIWAVFMDHVQTGNHDSVQDALSALRLYEKYKELEQSGNLDNALADISTKGQMHNFKVPRDAHA